MDFLSASLSAFIVAVAIELVFHGVRKESLFGLIYRKLKRGGNKSYNPNTEKDLNRLIDRFNTFLINDQEAGGLHPGQFGLYHRVKEEEGYNPKLSAVLSAKPRLFLTRWPVVVLLKYPELIKSQEMLTKAKNGVVDILKDDWVPVLMGATTKPHPESNESLEHIITYRHTMRAAQILLDIDPKLPTPKIILGRMLDPASDMQTSVGGWRQCKTVFTDEDLWASVYATDFLFSCLGKTEVLQIDESTISQIKETLRSTINWLKEQWKNDYWSYGKVCSEENSPHVLSEIYYALREYDRELLNEVLDHLSGFLDASGQPSIGYIEKLQKPGNFSAIMRLAYPHYLARSESQKNNELWQNLFINGVRNIKYGYNCVDVAMALDMAIIRKKHFV